MPPGKHWRSATRRRDGTYVRGTWVRNQGRHQSESPPPRPPSPPGPPPYPSPSSPPPQPTPRRSKRRKIAIAVTATLAVGAGAVTVDIAVSGNSADASSGITVQANLSLKQVVTALEKLQFAGTYIAQPTGSNCAQSASGDVRQFLTLRPCKESAIAAI